MIRVPRAEQKIRTRSRLIEAAGRLFLAHGVEGVSLDAVAEAAGFSKGAVYANFAGKEDLLLAVGESISPPSGRASPMPSRAPMTRPRCWARSMRR